MVEQAPTKGPPRDDRGVRKEASVYRCHFCGSDDSMAPFHRRPRVFVLSAILPTLEWRYCRACVRHFLVFRRTQTS